MCVLPTIAGCSAENTSEDSASSEQKPYSERVQSYLEEATSEGASETQIDELREALATGEVPYETMRGATQRAVDCMSNAGLDASIADVTQASGLEVPMYRASHGEEIDPDTGWEMIRACETSETYWLSAAYQQQPSAREQLSQYVRSKETELRECLQDNGVEADDDADGWELAELALEFSSAPEGGFDCLSTVGIDGL